MAKLFCWKNNNVTLVYFESRVKLQKASGLPHIVSLSFYRITTGFVIADNMDLAAKANAFRKVGGCGLVVNA